MNNTSPLAPYFDLAHAISTEVDMPGMTLTDCIRSVGIMLSYDELEGLTPANADAVSAALFLLVQADADEDKGVIDPDDIDSSLLMDTELADDYRREDDAHYTRSYTNADGEPSFG